MGKDVHLRGVQIPYQEAVSLCVWLRRVIRAHRNGGPTIGAAFLDVHGGDVWEFTTKVRRAALRRGGRWKEPVSLSTLGRGECVAVRGYLEIRISADRSELIKDIELIRAVLHTSVIFHEALARGRGRPRRTVEQAARLIDAYRRAPSSYRGTSERLKYDFSGIPVRDAKRTLATAAERKWFISGMFKWGTPEFLAYASMVLYERSDGYMPPAMRDLITQSTDDARRPALRE